VSDTFHDGTSSRNASGDASADASADARVPEFTIRPLTSVAEYQACVDVQREVWGPGYDDVVAASVLQIAAHVGGIVLGAFAADGELVGFIFGLTGIKDGKTVHWSHLLGVRNAARNSGVGRMLKERQRAELARMGISETHWTFDPLVAKNAHLNLNRLGASVEQYVRDMYGTTGSPLHYGLVTDRLIASCPPDRDPRWRVPLTAAAVAAAPVLTHCAQPGDVALDTSSKLPPVVLIEIPTDIQLIIERSPAEAAGWRAAVRHHFEWALGGGYTVTGLHRDPVTSRSFYTLELEAAAV
jgi:predicted GNAT superfamily acetyltransferase